jgi:hypothetical protein
LRLLKVKDRVSNQAVHVTAARVRIC